MLFEDNCCLPELTRIGPCTAIDAVLHIFWVLEQQPIGPHGNRGSLLWPSGLAHLFVDSQQPDESRCDELRPRSLARTWQATPLRCSLIATRRVTRLLVPWPADEGRAYRLQGDRTGGQLSEGTNGRQPLGSKRARADGALSLRRGGSRGGREYKIEDSVVSAGQNSKHPCTARATTSSPKPCALTAADHAP